jgi:hypothetical protein
VKSVTALLLKQRDRVRAPAFPDVCCYCGDPAHDTIQVEVRGVKLDVPYCEAHFRPASEYINKVIPRFFKVHGVYTVALAIVVGLMLPTTLGISRLGVQIAVGVVGFFLGLFFLVPSTGDVLTRPVLIRGARRLGFADPTKIAPGIIGGGAKEEPGSGRVRLELSFADDSYADLFDAEQRTNN